MRKITTLQIAVFAMLFLLILAITLSLALMFYLIVPAGEFRAIVTSIVGLILYYLVSIVVYRLFLMLCPLRMEKIAVGSRMEFNYQLNTLFYLVIFYSLTRTHFIPVPLMRAVYLSLGARLGENTYSAGSLLDPPLTVFGSNCIVGHDAVIFAHAIEGPNLSLAPIVVGDNVTIGAKAIVMSGVSIGNNAIVSAGALVLKGAVIGEGEVWGGVPARRLNF